MNLKNNFSYPEEALSVKTLTGQKKLMAWSLPVAIGETAL
jgi:hypothetical protein